MSRSKFFNIIGILFIVYIVVFIAGMTRSAFTEADVPNEYQEVTNIQLTDSFLKGVNPYSVSVATDKDSPGLIYEYGPVYSLIVALFARIIPVDIISLHYAVSLIAMLAAAVIATVLMHENAGGILPAAAAFLFIINCTWRYGYVNAVPDALALMLSILVLFVETRRPFKLKELTEAVLIVLIFYTKVYFVFAALPLFIYKLIKDKKAALRFFLFGAVIMGLGFIILNMTCPLLFTYMIYYIAGPIGASKTGSSGGSGWSYEILQLKSLAGIYIVMFIVTVLGMIYAFKKKADEKNDLKLLLMINIIAAVPALIVLGKNDGAWLSYYLQLIMPYIIMFSLIFINDMSLHSEGKAGKAAWVILYMLMLLFTAYRSSVRLPYYYMTADQRKTWDDAYELLDECLAKGEVYYSPVFGFHAIKHDQYIYNGLAANPVRRYEGYNNTPWLRTLFPDAGAVMENRLEYKEKLEGRIRNGEFELITAIEGDDGTDRLIKISDVEAGPYEYIGSIDLPVSRVCYTVKLFRRAR
ncbi:MAG: glycosyltransferase family 39 protein [Lachnospiraceae bacterium]|nr:glycosyltransferase family 39 protein [Lachnospiraceae bacterium]